MSWKISKNKVLVVRNLLTVVIIFNLNLKAQETADTTLASLYENKAYELFNKKEIDSSLFYMEKAATMFEAAGAYKKAIKLYVELCGDYSDAYYKKHSTFGFKYLYRAKKLAENLPFDAQKPVYQRFWLCYTYTNQIDSAFKYITLRMQEKPRSAENRYGQIFYRRASYFTGFFQHDSAIFNYKKSLPYFEKIKLTGKIVDCHRRIAQTYFRLGRISKGNNWLQSAISIAQKGYLGTDKQYKLVDIYHLEAVVTYQLFGDNHTALNIAQTAIHLETNMLGRNRERMLSHFELLTSQIYLENKEYEKALEHCLRALNPYQEEDVDTFVSDIYKTLGNIYSDMGKFDQAFSYYDKAANILQFIYKKDNDLTASINIDIGQAHLANKNYESAINYFKKALGIAQNVYGDKYYYVAIPYKHLSKTYYEMGDIKTALTYNQHALVTLFEDFSDKSVYQNPQLESLTPEYLIYRSILDKANFLYKAYQDGQNSEDLKAAFNTFELVFDLGDKIRASRPSELSKLNVGETFSDHFVQGIETALSMHRLTGDEKYRKKAYQFAQRSKSALLSDALNEADAQKFGNIPEDLLDWATELQEEIAFIETDYEKLKRNKDAEEDSVFQKMHEKLFFLKDAYKNLIARFEKEYPAYYELAYQTSVSSIADIQSALDERTAILEYIIGEEKLYTFTLTRSSYDVTVISVDSSFIEIVHKVQASLRKNSEAHLFAERSATLYNTVFAPIKNYLQDKQKLIIIPDGELNYLPFEALVQSPVEEVRENRNYRELNYLIHDFEISYHYSVNLFLKSRGKEIPQFAHNAGVFAPVFSENEQNGKIKSSGASVLGGIARWWAESITRDGKHFNPLVYSEKEAEGILEAFEWEPQKNLLYLHNLATEENFKENAHKFRYLHLATHSFVNEESPKLSGIAFSQPKDSSVKEDGILYSGEIYNLNLNADLVTLSSCESGLGKLVKGEGMIAMTRGFLYAGAANVAVSLWKVLDKHTSELMIEFYQQIAEGAPYASALRAAKLKLINDERTAFPASWSSFILIGSKN